jgi:hypothetical protein
MERTESKKKNSDQFIIEKNDWNKWLGIGIGLMILGFILVPLLVTRINFLGSLSKTGEIGDTIGGLMGPIVGVVGGVLTFLAFKVQFEANQQQKRDLQIERFESRLFSMLETHRNNVSEIRLSNPYHYHLDNKTHSAEQLFEGRSAIEVMFKELRAIYKELESLNSDKSNSPPVSESIQFETAYFLFFFGASDGKMNASEVEWKGNAKQFFDSANQFVFGLQEEIRAKFYDFPAANGLIDGGISLNTFASNSQNNREPEYLFARGNSQWLSQYFRHIFQMMDYIDSSTIFNYPEKYDYVRLIRSQLSHFEQLLIFYNSLSVLGKPLRDNGWLKKYCLVKSIPLHMADFYKKPLDELDEKNEHGKVMFEWVEILERIKQIE